MSTILTIIFPELIGIPYFEQLKLNLMKKIRNVGQFLKTMDVVYHYIGLGSLLALIIKTLFFNDIPAPLPFFSKVSPVVDGILGSVIASYIFYMFCIYPPMFREKKTSAVFVNFILKRIKLSFADQMRGVSDTLNYDSTSEDFLRAFEGIVPWKNTAPLKIYVEGYGFKNSDWFQYFEHQNEHLQKNIALLMNSRIPLDIETLHTLNLINDSAWFSAVTHMTNWKSRMSAEHNPFLNQGNPRTSFCICMYDLKEHIRKLQSAIDSTESLLSTPETGRKG